MLWFHGSSSVLCYIILCCVVMRCAMLAHADSARVAVLLCDCPADLLHV